jgi:peptidoglycan hydrolase CwlO-like protein
MSEPLSKFFKGLTTQHASAVWLLCGMVFWVAEIKPRIQAAESVHQGLTNEVTRIADTLGDFRKEMAEVRTEVKVQGVLISSMNELKSDIKDLRTSLSTTNSRITNWKEP